MTFAVTFTQIFRELKITSTVCPTIDRKRNKFTKKNKSDVMKWINYRAAAAREKNSSSFSLIDGQTLKVLIPHLRLGVILN